MSARKVKLAVIARDGDSYRALVFLNWEAIAQVPPGTVWRELLSLLREIGLCLAGTEVSP